MRTRIVIALVALGAAACASTAPPELVSARAAYAQAAGGPAAELAPGDLHVAQESLQAAERSFQRDGDADSTRDLVYAAERKAEIADVRAHTAQSMQTRTQALAAADVAKDNQVRLTSAQLQTAQQAVATEGQALAVEQQARVRAERRATQAQNDLARIAAVKQEPRGMVITLEGSVLFASGKSDLLPAAQAKLSQVADVLANQDKDSRIRVEGYTDSQGSVSFNQDLSQRRADAVRGYLAAHGIAADRLSAEGFGPGKPVADNASPEGRADNRRVEIVVEPPKGGGDER
ncbi:MAG TPA: OmpA family protein [Polyangiaceae bacterium]|jgi:outer membrane protein OmpA-like peptidoglycan-associated protein